MNVAIRRSTLISAWVERNEDVSAEVLLVNLLRPKPIVLTACLALVMAVPSASAQQEIDIKMELSKSTILLGEPVWVLVTARNASKAALKFNPGDYCFMFGQMPVTAVVPDAAPGSGKPIRCTYGSVGGNCVMGGNTTTLVPGQSATWRYLLEGDFHFIHAGTYRVEVTSHPGKAFQSVNDKSPVPARPAPVTQTLTLEVLPEDDAALLVIEKQVAADTESQILGMAKGALQSKRLLATTTDRDEWFRESQNVRRVRSGLAAQPAPGMEAVFEHWLQLPNDFEGDAVVGLMNLNSQESREALAKIAETPNKPNSHIEEAATYALGEMGDSTYFPLMVQLMVDPDERVRRAAIQGVGNLGGEAAVPVLLEEIRTAPSVERNDAMSVLGNTKSRAAVKALINLTGGKGNDYQSTWWPLFVLTHHSVPKVTYMRTAEQTYDAWQKWWDAGGKNAPVYSPYECAAKEGK